MEKGFPFYKVFEHRTGRRVRYQVWLCADVGGTGLLKQRCEDSFDDYLQAARRAAELNNEYTRAHALE